MLVKVAVSESENRQIISLMTNVNVKQNQNMTYENLWLDGNWKLELGMNYIRYKITTQT